MHKRYKLPTETEGNSRMYFPSERDLHNPRWSLEKKTCYLD